MAMRYYAPFPERDRDRYKALPRHVLRIGDADRDAAAADLGEHYVAGRLTLDELNERLGEVFAARTHGQLWTVMADLPASAWRPWSQAGASLPAAPRIDDRDFGASGDRAGRIAALSLLVLAMLIWLTTALIFMRHGYYSHPGPTSWLPSR